MIYRFTFIYNDKLLHYTCMNEKEADIWFNLMLAYGISSFRIDTIKRSRRVL